MMVRLQPGAACSDGFVRNMFQFHDGTITTKKTISHPVNLFRFQFHDGTITTYPTRSSIWTMLTFQFHDGTITTLSGFSLYLSRYWFQFHDGTITTLLRCHFHNFKISFNSMMVRLQPKFFGQGEGCRPPFQFHDGTITTRIFSS